MAKRTFFLALAALLCSCRQPDSGTQPANPANAPGAFTLSSEDLSDGGPLPALCTCDGQNLSPALKWANAPAKTAAFALIMRDLDAPNGDFLHWAAADIPAAAVALPRGVKFKAPALELENDFIEPGYGGPCPPPGNPHRYVFTLYAVDLSGTGMTRLAELDSFLKRHTLAQASLTGLYQRKEKKKNAYKRRPR